MDNKNFAKSFPHFPHIGQRMIKTAVAVFCCLLIYRFLGYKGSTMPVEAVITTIICMQPFVNDSREFAINRFSGTIIGAAWGMLFYVLLSLIPILGRNFIILYALMSLGVLLSVYTAVVIKIPDVSSLSAIVFICIVAQFPDIEDPHMVILQRFVGVMIGTAVAFIINILRLPREKNQSAVFFIHAKDLLPDRFSPASSYVHFHLNRLYEDGAKICIMSGHAPAMFTMQMSNCHLSVPLIVMGGAALYDINENKYLSMETIKPESSVWLQSWLRKQNISFYVYIIRNNRTCIFHDGSMNPQEEQVYKKLRKSPYRNYLDGGDFHLEEIVYFKIIAENSVLTGLESALAPILSEYSIRTKIRSQASSPDINALYIYSEKATLKNARKKLMKILNSEHPELYPVMISSKNGYHSEHDAAVLIHRLKNVYEPVRFFKRKK